MSLAQVLSPDRTMIVRAADEVRCWPPSIRLMIIADHIGLGPEGFDPALAALLAPLEVYVLTPRRCDVDAEIAKLARMGYPRMAIIITAHDDLRFEWAGAIADEQAELP